jgi:hypothetical protein
MASGFKTGGRKAGTPNKISSEIKEVLSDFLQKEIDSLPEYFEAIEPKVRLEIIAKLLPYVLPKAEPETQGANDATHLPVPIIVMSSRK